MRLSLDTREGVHATFDETADPTREQIFDAVDRLDGKQHTEVSLRRDEPFEYLSIAGGPDLFLVSGEARDGAFVQLHNPAAEEGTVNLVCGGQASDFALRDVVGRGQLGTAVDQFFDGLSENLPEPWSVA